MSRIVSLSESALIALHSLAMVARNTPNPMRIKRIAEAISGSENTIAKVMQRLVKAGFLVSSRGPAGGFALAVPAEDVSLLEIYECIEGPLRTDGCSFDKKTCVFGDCIFGNFMDDIAQDFKKKFSEKKLADYV